MGKISDCGLCAKQDDCETHKLMNKLATSSSFEMGAQRGILEILEGLAEYCTQAE